MPFRIQVHISGDDPVVLDVEELPKPSDNYVMGMNPQRRDGKEVTYINREVDQVIFPDRKSTRLNSSHQLSSYAVFCLKKNKRVPRTRDTDMVLLDDTHARKDVPM